MLQSTENNKKRSAAIDMIKGLSIMTLFYLHFENGWMNVTNNYFLVRSPVFYLVVGWLWGMSSHKRTIQEHWKKRKQGLVKPYLWFSIIILVFDLFLVLLHLFESFVLYRDLYKTLCLRGIGTLWFLPALLGGELLFLAFRDRPISLRLFLYIIAFTIILCYNFWHINVSFDNLIMKELLDAPFRVIKDISDCLIYLSIAYFISSHYGRELISMNKAIMFLVGVICWGIDFYLMNCLELNLFFNGISFIIGNVIVGIGTILLFTSIEKCKIIEAPLSYCGRNSLIIMAVHYGILLQIAILFDKFVLGNSTYYGNRTIIYFAVAVFLQILAIKLINTKFRFIIGK